MTTLFRRALLLALLPFFALTLPACDSGGDNGGARVFGGVDFDRLFAAPTPAEIAAVQDDWDARNPEARNVSVVETVITPAFRAVLFSYDTYTFDDGQAVTNYGVVRIPTGALDLPVIVYNYGGDNGTSSASVFGLLQGIDDQASGGFFDDVVVVAHTYRSEPFTTNAGVFSAQTTYTAAGSESPWDRDVDDAFAALDAVLDTYPAETDASRIGTLGISRGGDVSLLMGVRGNQDADLPAVDVVTDFFGPADFTDSSIQLLAQVLLTSTDPRNEGAYRLPGGAYLFDNVLVPVRDGALSYDAGRLEIVRRSPAFFTDDFDNLQVHHHEADPVVPVEQSKALRNAAAVDAPSGEAEFNFYGTPVPLITDRNDPSLHNPFNLIDGGETAIERTIAFHRQYLIGTSTLAAR